MVIWKLATLNTVYIRHLLDSPLEIYKTSLDHPQTGRVFRGPRSLIPTKRYQAYRSDKVFRLSPDWSKKAYQEGLGRDLGCNLIQVCGTERSHPCFLWRLEIFVIPFVGFILHALIECVNGTLNLIRLARTMLPNVLRATQLDRSLSTMFLSMYYHARHADLRLQVRMFCDTLRVRQPVVFINFCFQ